MIPRFSSGVNLVCRNSSTRKRREKLRNYLGNLGNKLGVGPDCCDSTTGLVTISSLAHFQPPGHIQQLFCDPLASLNLVEQPESIILSQAGSQQVRGETLLISRNLRTCAAAYSNPGGEASEQKCNRRFRGNRLIGRASECWGILDSGEWIVRVLNWDDVIMAVTKLTLNNGATMPAIGLGTISFNESHEKIKFAIVTAIRVSISQPSLITGLPSLFAAQGCVALGLSFNTLKMTYQAWFRRNLASSVSHTTP